MANITEPTPQIIRDWQKWVAGRPPHVRKAIRATGLVPWKLYRLKSTGHRVHVIAFGETPHGITVRAVVSAQYNFLGFERQVFGLDPTDLEECDLPGPDEQLGALLTGDDVDAIEAACQPGEDLIEAIKAAAWKAAVSLKTDAKA